MTPEEKQEIVQEVLAEIADQSIDAQLGFSIDTEGYLCVDIDSYEPFDSRIEYLRGTGTQYIDTGIAYRSSLSIEAKLKMESTTFNGEYLFGIKTTLNGTTYRWAVDGGSNSYVSPHFGTVTSASVPFTRNEWHTVRADYRYITVDGETVDTEAAAFAPESLINLYLYGRSDDNVAAMMRELDISSFKIIDNGKTVRDFIPVRKGNIGYLYDNISSQLFGNAGTGSFVLGPDK